MVSLEWNLTGVSISLRCLKFGECREEDDERVGSMEGLELEG